MEWPTRHSVGRPRTAGSSRFRPRLSGHDVVCSLEIAGTIEPPRRQGGSFESYRFHRRIAVDPQWQPASHPPSLTTDEVHVWRIALEVSNPFLLRLREILADDERRRADRFHFEKDRRHFTAARGV